MSKIELINQAKRLYDESNWEEASKFFNKAIKEYSDQLDAWDVFYMVKCARKGVSILNIHQEALRFKELEPLNQIYAWLLYDYHVKDFEYSRINIHERGIEKITERVDQKDFNIDKADDIPCPYTVGVFKLIKAYHKPNLNINKLDKWFAKIDPNKLSKKEIIFEDNLGKVRKIASTYEDYYSILSKLKLKQKKYAENLPHFPS